MNTYLENIIFFYILKHIDLVLIFKPEYFDNPIVRQLFDIIKPHILEYKEEPTELQVIHLVKVRNLNISEDVIHSLWESRDNLSQYTDEWLYNNTKAKGEWLALLYGTKRVIAFIKTALNDITYENCAENVQKLKAIFQADTNFAINTSNSYDFFDPVNHQQTELETRHTGYNFIDQCLDGGWANKTLNVFMGSPKVGKSMWLCNLCANSVRNGENSIYITLEMAYLLVAQRIGSNLFNIPIDQYKEASKDLNYLKAKEKDFYNNSLIEPGKFFLHEFPTSSATVYDIESTILKTEQDLSTESTPFKFKNIFIDYINIMKDAKNPNSENMYLKIKSICEDVRAMAQRNNWCVISLTQTNRSGYDSTDVGMSSVSESAGLLATVDSLFGIIQSPVMRVENTYYIKAVAIRNSGHMGDRKRFDFNPKYLRITENTTENIIAENMSLPGATQSKQHINNYTNNNYNNTFSNQPFVELKPQLGLTEMNISGQGLFD